MLITPSRRTVEIPWPWTNVYGVGRSLLATATFLTLVFTPNSTFFRPVSTLGTFPVCNAGVTRAGLFCVFPEAGLTWAKILCLGTLLVTASGWRPRVTCIPHAYVAFTVVSGIALPDGGDQVAAILTLILIPVALTDGRRWQWTRPYASTSEMSSKKRLAVSLAAVSLGVAKLQVAGIYFQSSTAKLSHQEWADGTAIYYWFHSSTFGMPGWMASLTAPILGQAWVVVAITWGALIVELSVAMGIFMRQRFRWIVLCLGFLLHLAIALTMGLWSFAITMWAALILELCPLGYQVPFRRIPSFAVVSRPPLLESSDSHEEELEYV